MSLCKTAIRLYSNGRLPKRKMGIVLGYIGTNYHGMQYNEGVQTVESEVFRVLCATGCISSDNAVDFSKNSFSRATRTDKGVHALGNLLALKMQRFTQNLEEVTKELNAVLPEDIRVWGLVPVKKKFNARLMTSTRHYKYMLPTSLLSRHKNFKYDSEQQQRYAQLWKQFEGTHNFHNFTVGKQHTEGSSTRYLKALKVSPPFWVNDKEWVTIYLHGQSFLLHQIRKMVHFTVQCMRSEQDAHALLQKATSLEKMYIPLAPASNLYLQYPTFDGYNSQVNALGLEVPQLHIEYSQELRAFEHRLQETISRTDMTNYQQFLEEQEKA